MIIITFFMILLHLCEKNCIFAEKCDNNGNN